MKRFVVLVSALVLTFSITFLNGIRTIGASSHIDKVTIEDAEVFAQDYLITVAKNSFDGWKNAKLVEGKKLYDFDGNLTSYLFQVKNQNDANQGYIIISAIPEIPGLLESTREGTNPYESVEEKDSIYVGPLLHFGKVDNHHVKSLNTNEILTKSNLKTNAPLNIDNIKNFAEENIALRNSSQVGISAVTNYNYRLLSGVPDYSWHIGCGPTAGANIVKYWDSRGYSNLVGTTQTTNNLIDQLATFMETNRSNGQTTVANMRYGMLKFWEAKGYYPTVLAYPKHFVGIFGIHKNEINVSRPTIITTAKHPVWGDHAMTGVGFEEYYDQGSVTWYRQLILRDTWSTTPVNYWVPWSSYFDYMIKVIPR